MPCPPEYVPNVEQFSDDPDAFWREFLARQQIPREVNTSDDAVEAWLKLCFEKRYAHCFAKVVGDGHRYDAYNLPEEVKAEILACMLS